MTIKFIDLFAGLGGTRIGFEKACISLGLIPECVMTSEIKQHAIETYKNYFKSSDIKGDITKIESSDIPDFDYLLGGFPCQPFSSAGKRMGFFDTRGTLFFEIERILKDKKPMGFILENVEGLVNHDNGKTLQVIINNLNILGYHTQYKVLNAVNFGVPQARKRIYILGTLKSRIDLENLPQSTKYIKDIQQSNLPSVETDFTKKILSKYSPQELYGKAIKDKRGGINNIHSWDIGIKGDVSKIQQDILNFLLKERRKKHWAEAKNIKWMDGMPLTIQEITDSFQTINLFESLDIKKELDNLVEMGYLAFEYPKKQIVESNQTKRVYDENGVKGYNIVTGKLSFEFNHILNPDGFAPTIVATDSNKIGIVDGSKLRKISTREGLRMFGFPDDYEINLNHNKTFDLIGNSIVVPIIEILSTRVLQVNLK
jgi:DNA (cytosine-5)-methyltransferase 1